MFEDILDLRLNLTDSDLSKLDAQAKKAEKILERAQKQRLKAGGIYGKSLTGKTMPKGFEEEVFAGRFKRGQKIGRIGSPIKRDDFKTQIEKGVWQKMMERDLGGDASEAMSILKNPVQGIQKIVLSFLPELAVATSFIGAIKGALEILELPGMPLDVYFVDKLNTLTNALGAKDTQESIRAGHTQEIITTRAGSTNPRDAYNTYALFNKNARDLNYQFSVRRPTGY